MKPMHAMLSSTMLLITNGMVGCIACTTAIYVEKPQLRTRLGLTTHAPGSSRLLRARYAPDCPEAAIYSTQCSRLRSVLDDQHGTNVSQSFLALQPRHG
mmetsp:Transcript_2931/g.6414  ORF Transcript_2931/g.6414 Transcript_2931/m.6414 type:complete len:99 (+) Transcript_2931:735-1031(+)